LATIFISSFHNPAGLWNELMKIVAKDGQGGTGAEGMQALRPDL
jgi:hypothetical protein